MVQDRPMASRPPNSAQTCVRKECSHKALCNKAPSINQCPTPSYMHQNDRETCIKHDYSLTRVIAASPMLCKPLTIDVECKTRERSWYMLSHGPRACTNSKNNRSLVKQRVVACIIKFHITLMHPMHKKQPSNAFPCIYAHHTLCASAK